MTCDLPNQILVLPPQTHALHPPFLLGLQPFIDNRLKGLEYGNFKSPCFPWSGIRSAITRGSSGHLQLLIHANDF